MNNIVWLASYPKSGNTWLRIFLSNLLNEQNEPVNINKLTIGGPISSDRFLFDSYTGIESGHLTLEEIELLIPKVHLYRSCESKELEFVKTHDAYTYNSEKQPIIPKKATNKVIYLIRNPLDVCVSFAYHIGHSSIEETINKLNDPNFYIVNSNSRQKAQLQQKLLSWSRHVKSWQAAIPEKTLIIRYEDMKQKTLATFEQIVNFLGLSYTKKKIELALKFSSMPNLIQQEQDTVFREKLPGAKKFFRKGIIGSWRDELSPAQVRKIIKAHKEVMLEFGYLDYKEKPIF